MEFESSSTLLTRGECLMHRAYGSACPGHVLRLANHGLRVGVLQHGGQQTQRGVQLPRGRQLVLQQHPVDHLSHTRHIR